MKPITMAGHGVDEGDSYIVTLEKDRRALVGHKKRREQTEKLAARIYNAAFEAEEAETLNKVVDELFEKPARTPLRRADDCPRVHPAAIAVINAAMEAYQWERAWDAGTPALPHLKRARAALRAACDELSAEHDGEWRGYDE
jgi:hypothetical protein|tara:strand:+ start:79 stop:504 length:426 start_codon:yes stop_codon:yes gene_type:complete